jgi:hypothetical protein
MNDLTKQLIKKLALKNDEFRESMPVNFITHEIVSLKSQKPGNYKWPRNTQYRYDHWSGSLILSPKLFLCDQINSVLKDVQNFNDFNETNNPFNERNFGDLFYKSLNFNGVTEFKVAIFFKIEFWDDKTMQFESENHLRDKCYRTLTIFEGWECQNG